MRESIFGATVGVVLAAAGWGISKWQFWVSCIAINLLHQWAKAKR